LRGGDQYPAGRHRSGEHGEPRGPRTGHEGT
jgi:hypothetical protein